MINVFLRQNVQLVKLQKSHSPSGTILFINFFLLIIVVAPNMRCKCLTSPCHSETVLSLTWGTRSAWGCGRTGGKLWDTCRNTAALLRSDTRHTSPRWDLPPALLSSQTLAWQRAEDTALSQCWTLIRGPGLGQTPSAAAGALTEPRCCCRAGWTQHWTAPVANENAGYIQSSYND